MIFTAENEAVYQERVCRLLGVDPRQADRYLAPSSLRFGGTITANDPPPAPSETPPTDDADDGSDWANNTGFNFDRLYDIINHPGKVDTGGETVEPGHREPPVNDRYW